MDQAPVLGAVQALKRARAGTPAFAVPYLLMRSDQEAVCLELPIEAGR